MQKPDVWRRRMVRLNREICSDRGILSNEVIHLAHIWAMPPIARSAFADMN